MINELKDKKVVITGGSSGIGLATAISLAEMGAQVVIAGRSQSKLNQAQNKINGNSRIYELDVTDEHALQQFYQTLGEFDHLITAASGAAMGGFLELDTGVARDLVESKLWGQYYTAKHAVPFLKQSGSITLFSGIVSRKPIAGASTYAMIAGAIESLSRSLAIELAPIRVNCITPGFVDTPAWQSLLPDEIRVQQFNDIASVLPAKRIGNASDIAKTVIAVLQNDFMTGSVIDIDGGHRLI